MEQQSIYPFTVNWHFINRCNMSFRYCFVPKQSEELSLSQSLSILSKLQTKFTKINLVGGEPTLSPYLPHLVKEAKALGFVVSIITNGYELIYNEDHYKSLYKSLDIIGLFVCETDTQYVFENSGVRTDFRATNKLGLSTRYLFKDRNMAIHDSKHVSVQNLLEPKYVDNLLYFLGDANEFLNTLLSKAKEKEKECVITFLLNKTKKLYESVIKKTNEVFKEKSIKNLPDDLNLFERTVVRVKEILKEEYKYKYFPLIYDKKLSLELEDYLNDMFAVNEKNIYGTMIIPGIWISLENTIEKSYYM